MSPDEAATLVDALGAEHPKSLPLARFAALAAQVDPKLIRTLRIELLSDSTASAEADSWFSPLVQSRSPRGFVFFPEVAELLRRGLSDDDATRAFDIVRRCHEDGPPAVRVEEELNCLSLDSRRNHDRIRDLLDAAVAALWQDPTSALGSWAGRFLSRLPGSLRGHEQTDALAVASDLKLKRTGILERRLGGKEAIPRWLSPFFDGAPLGEVGVHMNELGIVFGSPEGAPHRLTVAATDPIVLELRFDDGTGPRSKLVFVFGDRSTEPERVPLDGLRIVTMKGEVWAVEPDAETKRSLARVVTARATSAAYGNLVVWSDQPPDDCIGYAVERRHRDEKVVVLGSSLGSPKGEYSSTLDVPIEGNTFVDTTAPREAVSYRIVPLWWGGGADERDTQRASSWTAWVRAGPDRGQSAWMYFNRGAPGLIPEWRDDAVASFSSGPEPDYAGGDLVAQLHSILTEARATECRVYAALCGLEDPALIGAFGAFGARAQVILGEWPNPSSRSIALVTAQLRARGAVVIDRVSPVKRGIPHNKFFILTNAAGQPTSVWTGNVSLKETGLLKQLSGGLYVTDAGLARNYYRYWELLAAGRRNPSAPDRYSETGNSAWFGPAAGGDSPEIEEVVRFIETARDGIVFALSMPPRTSRIMDAIRGAARRGIYVAGLVAASAGRLDLYQGEELVHLKATDTGAFGLKATFVLALRAIAIDPFGSSPLLVSGSHSLSNVASVRNEENLVILRGYPALVQHVAATLEHAMMGYLARRQRSGTTRRRSEAKGGWRAVVISPGGIVHSRFWLGHSANATSHRIVNERATAPAKPLRKKAKKKSMAAIASGAKKKRGTKKVRKATMKMRGKKAPRRFAKAKKTIKKKA